MNSGFVVYPDFVARVAGATTDGLVALRAPRTLALVSRSMALDERIAIASPAAAALLFDAVGRADSESRPHLLRLRRALFNARRPSTDALAAVGLLDDEAAHAVRAAVGLLEAREDLAGQLRATYADELVAARRQLRTALNDDFEKGLALSSETLARALPKYRRSTGERPNAKEQQVERGLLRYFTRMAAKPSPFGTFCTVIPGQFDAGEGVRIQGALAKRSHVRLNKALLPVLWRLLMTRPAVRDQLRTEVNSTLSRDQGRIVCLTTVRGVEAFQRLEASEVLEAVLSTCARHGRDIPYGQLIERMSSEAAFDATSEEVRQYLDRLIEVGVLRLRTGVPEQDPNWHRHLLAVLTPIDDDSARAACQMLRTLNDLCGAFEHAPSGERSRLLAEMRDVVKTGIVQLGGGGAFPTGFICYEDAGADAVTTVPAPSVAAAPFDVLAELLSMVHHIGWPMNEQATMRHFFDQRYAKTEAGVPLLQFYEDYSREHFKAHLEFERRTPAPLAPGTQAYDRGNPFNLPVVAGWRRMLDAIPRLVAERYHASPHDIEIVLRRAEIEALFPRGGSAAQGPMSLSVFCHLVAPAEPAGAWRVVVPGLRAAGGFGKYFSRFLYLFPADRTHCLNASNAALCADWIAEISGDADFNANLHPQLLPWQIDYPTYATETDSAQRISCADLIVMPCDDNAHALRLVHAPTGTPVWPVDLGFMNSRLRPALYQLLSRFQPPSSVSWNIPSFVCTPCAGAASTSPAADSDVQVQMTVPGSDRAAAAVAVSREVMLYSPRVVYEDAVVLARRKWTVPHTLVPRQLPDEAPEAFFARVQRWRTTHGIPTRVFVRVAPVPISAMQPPVIDDRAASSAPEALGSSDAQPTRSRYDDHKPQFVDLGSPLLLGLFATLGTGLPRFALSLEEALPDLEHALPSHEGSYLSEFMVQFNWGQERNPPATYSERRSDVATSGAHVG